MLAHTALAEGTGIASCWSRPVAAAALAKAAKPATPKAKRRPAPPAGPTAGTTAQRGERRGLCLGRSNHTVAKARRERWHHVAALRAGERAERHDRIAAAALFVHVCHADASLFCESLP